jgi:transposase-like protein
VKKEPSVSTRNSKNTTLRRRKYDEEFKQQALAALRNGQSPRSVAEAVRNENIILAMKRPFFDDAAPTSSSN